ncbi:MAG: signal peptidase I [Clostridiales bacterium]|nr:signal peptidase I [Clostridiales bacterium]
MEEHNIVKDATVEVETDSKKDSEKNAKKEATEWIQAIVTAVVLALLIRIFLFEIILVVGGSMIPTLDDGDRVFVNKIGYIIGEPELGDVVIFKTPEDGKTSYVKRVIGLPGDQVEIIDGIVYVNEESLSEPYISEQPFNDFALETVPEGRIFVLGDNRNHSKDSRDYHVGFVPMDNLVGKAVWRIWPLDSLSAIK